jgi:ABC-2 type transport system ATP-binding protein
VSAIVHAATCAPLAGDYTASMADVLTVTGARKQYDQTQALNNAAMSLHKGEWLALLGPNGAGKTTLIRAVAGRVRLDAGEITLLGHRLNGDATQARSARSRLGVVPQEIALYPLLTARENMHVFGELQGVRGPQLKQRVDWALQWTALEERADDLTSTFSGGMKRRLNIACGVLHQPEVVLLDEPTVGVDPQSRQRIWEMLGQLRQAGASLLLTTHQLDEAQQICDRIVIIDHGKSIADGTLDQLVSQTIGRSRRVTLAIDPGLPASDRAASLGGEPSADGRSIDYRIDDVAADLPPLLARLGASGQRVTDVRVEAPSLHAVFIHLTGRELRE